MITYFIESVISDHFDQICSKVVNEVNKTINDSQDQLDQVANEFRKFSDLFVYRGGNHVALHFKKSMEEISQNRSVLFVIR